MDGNRTREFEPRETHFKGISPIIRVHNRLVPGNNCRIISKLVKIGNATRNNETTAEILEIIIPVAHVPKIETQLGRRRNEITHSSNE